MSLPVLLLFCLGAGQDEGAPDNAHAGWWPKAQWTQKDAPPPPERIKELSRSYGRVDFPPIETPWGRASVTAAPSTEKEFRFDLVFSAPGEALTKGGLPDPQPAELEAALHRGNEVLARPTRAPGILGWVGGARGMSGDLLTEFAWLPNDLEDTWIRFRCKDRVFWFLLPYGIGSDPTKAPEKSERSGPPKQPAGAGAEDTVLVWTQVSYDLGWIDPQGAVQEKAPRDNPGWIHVSAKLSNPYDGACEVELYRDSRERWALSTPRTTSAIGIPAHRVLFARQEGIRRDDSYRRWDGFAFSRTSTELRTWGLLRVTIEEHVFEKAIPGSLFLNTHGRLPR